VELGVKMEEIKLDVQIRSQIGTRRVKSVRREDNVPAIVYGGDKGPTSIKVDRRSFERIMRSHKGQSVVFHLNVMEGDKKLRDYSAILKDEQFHPVSDKIQHIDFHRISLKDEIEVKVPLKAKGEPIGVKRDQGSLDHALWELDVICFPMSIPKAIEVDVSTLNIGDAIHVREVLLPKGVKTNHDPESIIFSVVPPMREEVSAEGEEAEEPEVINEKKEKPEAGSEEKGKS